MNKRIRLRKGRTEIDLGEVRDVFPEGYLNYDIIPGGIDDIIEHLSDEIAQSEIRLLLLVAHSPSGIGDLDLVVDEARGLITAMGSDIYRRETMDTIRQLSNAGFKYSVVESKETTHENNQKGQEEASERIKQADNEQQQCSQDSG